MRFATSAFSKGQAPPFTDQALFCTLFVVKCLCWINHFHRAYSFASRKTQTEACGILGSLSQPDTFRQAFSSLTLISVELKNTTSTPSLCISPPFH